MASDNVTKRRIIMTLFGVPMTGVSVAFFNVSMFGVDPFTVFVQGVYAQMPSAVSYGLTYVIISIVELIAVLIADRRKIGVGTVINLLFLGYITDYTSRLIRYLSGDAVDLIPLRAVFLAIGIVLMGFSLSLYFAADMGVSTHDAVSLIASEKQDRISFQYLRIISDVLCVIIGFILGGTFGIGTILAAVLCGPLVAFFRKRITDPIVRE